MDTFKRYNLLEDYLQSIGYKIPSAQLVIQDLKDVAPPPPFTSETFRANYFTFVLINKGEAAYTLDSTRYRVGEHTLYFTNPGHLKSYELISHVDARIMSFTDEFLKNEIDHNAYQLFPYLLSEVVPPNKLTLDEFQGLWRLTDMLLDESNNVSKHRKEILASIFRIFLLKINNELYQDYNPLTDGNNSNGIIQRFKENIDLSVRELLEEKRTTIISISELADLQYLHPNYLSTVIKEKTNKQASQWIVERIITEAKGQLKSNNLSVKEVAYKLGFTNANYFSKYFKKATGMTPTTYANKA